MPSPACTVTDGAGSPQTTTSAYASATAGNTITIRLADITGVDVWSISCVYTDETTSASAITASLSVNYTTKVATFTAPAAGKSMIFESKINLGKIGNTTVAGYTTRFKVGVPAANGKIVGCVNETTEHNAASGMVGPINDILRTGAGGLVVGGTAVVGYVPTVSSISPTVVTYAAPTGGSSSGIDYTIDFRTVAHDYKVGGDVAQTVAFTISANNGTAVPSTLASGLTITPRTGTSAAANLISSGANGLRTQLTSSPKVGDLGIDPLHLGLDRTRPFAIWLLLNRSFVSIPVNSEAGIVLMGNFVSGAPNVMLFAQHSSYQTWPGALKSYVAGRVQGSTGPNATPYTPEVFGAPETSDDVKISRFGATWAELYSTPAVSGAFPNSVSLAGLKRRGRIDADPLLMSLTTGLVFPNDDDSIVLHARADASACDVAYYAMRVVQSAA